MLLDNHVDVAPVIFGFGLCLFLALVFLLNWQHRKHAIPNGRVRRGLRVYVSDHEQEAA